MPEEAETLSRRLAERDQRLAALAETLETAQQERDEALAELARTREEIATLTEMLEAQRRPGFSRGPPSGLLTRLSARGRRWLSLRRPS